jgi:hypothetical protein
MQNQSRSLPRPASFRPALEALEDRRVPSGLNLAGHANPMLMAGDALQQSEAPQPVVGLTLANDRSGSILVVERNLDAQIEPLIRLRRVVGESQLTEPSPEMAQTPRPVNPLTYLKYDFLRTLDGGTAPVTTQPLYLLKI